MARYNKYDRYIEHCPLSSGFTNTPYRKPDLFPPSNVKETLHLGLSNGSIYNAWLRAVRSGIKFRWGQSVQTSDEAHPASYTQWIPGLFPGGEAAGSWLWNPLHLASRLEQE
jgi:hypothetical protein